MYINHKIYESDVASVAGENLPWEKLSGKSVLLTGATGLIGTMMVDVLMKKKPRRKFECENLCRRSQRENRQPEVR